MSNKITTSRAPLSIGRAKELLKKICLFNMQRYADGDSHDSFIIPYFVGDPGSGKTAIPKQVAKELEIAYFQTIVAQFDPGELAGLPFMGEVPITRMIDGKEVHTHETRMIRLRPSYLPDYKDTESQIGVYNLDELPQAMQAGQNVMSQLVNEYRIGEHPISQGITMCATGNKPENKAGTHPMPAHLKDRLMFIYIEPNAEEWIRYGSQKGLNPLVRTYIRKYSDKLSKFTPGTDANPTPRSWEKMSNILDMGLDEDTRFSAFCGTVGEGQATEFETYVRVEDRLPDPDEVIKNPATAPVFGNKDVDVLNMLLASLADKANKDNIGNIIQYLRRLPNKEFNAVFSQDCFTRAPELMDVKEVRQWKMTDGAQLMFG